MLLQDKSISRREQRMYPLLCHIVGVGFSYGDHEVGTSQEAAQAVWQMLQIFFADSSFSKYAGNDFAIWTESYGGHYGPTFAAYFLQQNAAIQSGSVTGTVLNLKTLGIGNGLTASSILL